jgi:hypothetical protein
MEAADPQDTFFVDVYVHDYTWCDYDDGEWWEHEKWSSASQFIQSQDTIILHLFQGWNLISFPRTPATPTLRGTFGDNIVSKVYTYKNNAWSGSIYDPASGNWQTPAGFGAITSLQAGVGYWVYCSAAGVDQDFYEAYLSELASYYGTCDTELEIAWTNLMVEVQPAAVGPVTPPSYALSAGWNLVGVPLQGSLDLFQTRDWWGNDEMNHMPVSLVTDFLASVKPHWKALYWYLPTFTLWSDCDSPDVSITFPAGYQIATPDTTQSPAWKLAYWLSAFGSLGISYIPQEVPAWVLGTEETFTTDLIGSFSGGDFGGDFEGYTSTDTYLEGDFDGIYNYDGTTYGEFDGWVDRDDDEVYDPGLDEDFSGTFHGWWSFSDDNDILMGGDFNGTTELGRTITGSYDATQDFGDSYYQGVITGTITSNGIFSNMQIDDAIMQDIAPVVMPGYGYWVWLDQAGTLIPVEAIATGGGSAMPSPTPIEP